MAPFVFTLSSGGGLKKIHRRLEVASSYDFEVTGGDIIDGIILDTFDNEIRRSGRCLLQISQTLLLINILNGEIVEQRCSNWSFLGELEKGPVAGSLKGVSRLRAFIPVSGIKIRRDRVLVLDDEGKTRVRIHWFSFFRKKKSLRLGITQPLRGYEHAHTELRKLLVEMHAEPCTRTTDIYSGLGVNSRNYSAKPDIRLVP
ncbi:MAG: hypothetical protein KAI39_07520, partial [Desulfobulbaceae bacterium]|nr:hypothetical protein [Desulfobulbaceae bacterium]